MNIRSLTRGDGAVIGAAVLLLIASFLPFFSLDHVDKSVNSWSPGLFPLLPTVTLAAIASAALLVVHRGQPAGRQFAGLSLQQWATALAVFVGWSALWSAFSDAVPDFGQGDSGGVSKGAGAWLTLVFGLAMAVVAVLSDRVPALKAPLAGAPRPQQQPYGAGGPQPYGMTPPQAGYGYPGGQQSVDPGYGQAVGQPAPPYAGSPAPQPQAAAAPAAEFSAFWFAVPVPRPLFAEDGSGGQIAELTPGTWYLAVDQRGQQLIAQTQDGRRGVLQDSSGIQRG